MHIFSPQSPVPTPPPSDQPTDTSSIHSSVDSLFSELDHITPPAEPNEPAGPQVSHADIQRMKAQLLTIKDYINNMLTVLDGVPNDISWAKQTAPHTQSSDQYQRVLEGYFDGEKMIADSGEEFAVPANYASKSKLVEGDRMKLSITPSGSFIYKQVQQIPRKRLVGELVFDALSNQWSALVDGKLYKVLKASVTFYRGTAGDEVVILVAEDTPCTWGAVDNIIHK